MIDMMSAEKYRFVDLFGNPLLVPNDVKYIGHIVGDGKSRVFCPSGVTQQEAELFYQMYGGATPDVKPVKKLGKLLF